jgi:hypothetical protein
VDGPPGHAKGVPSDQPCGNGKGSTKGGVIIVLPLTLSAAAARRSRRMVRSLRRRRSAE